MPLQLGQCAPTADLFGADNQTVALNHFWVDRPVVLTFLRHFGCQFCRAFLITLRGAYAEMRAHGAEVVAIAQGSPPQVAHFAQLYNIPFPMLADPTRLAYRAFDLAEGAGREVLNAEVALRMAAQASKGNLPGIRDHLRAAAPNTGSSLKQLGGTFVIAPGGTVLFAHVSMPIYEAPTMNELLAILDHLAPNPAPSLHP